jgi:CDP-glycerol glycerophosphotransferase (TagB/SpsB family)
VKEKKDLVSVIIPAYNAAGWIDQCLNSVINQTYKNIEIIVVNDGSSDRTGIIVEEYARKYDFIQFKSITNIGQGKVRNEALKIANGEYVMFIDSDDFIERNTLELAVRRIKEDKSDLVIFDWKYFHHRSKKYIYKNQDDFLKHKVLLGEKCTEILGISAYFTVNKLYRKSFLQNNGITYMENYIYEDIPFWVKVATCAEIISLIHNPLYNIRIANSSSTANDRKTSFHIDSFIAAMKESFDYLLNKKDNNREYDLLYRYFFIKFENYRKNRCPKELRNKFTIDFLRQMSRMNIGTKNQKNKALRYSVQFNVFKKERRVLFDFIVYSKNKVRNIRKNKNILKRKIKTEINKIKKIFTINKKEEIKDNENSKKIILFIGFDFRYTGNSRYLYEEILPVANKNSNFKIYFATESKLVEEKYRIIPKSDEFYKMVKTANMIIFESWIPKFIKKRPGCIWLQLWHGTPLKKMLFDSNEYEVLIKNPKHKVDKYQDINTWDYLLTDSELAENLFNGSFQFPKDKMLPIGYPRVKYLIDNIKNEQLKNEIKEKNKISKTKKIVAYLPTWRDYNFKTEEDDYSYALDIDELSNKLGNNYQILSKGHFFLNENENENDIETQELLLISDYLITDYSSVLFDAFPINLPVIIYSTDYEKYSKSRGLYEEIWNDLSPFTVNSTDGVFNKIEQYTIDENYKQFNKKYCYQNSYNQNLVNNILDVYDIKKCLTLNKKVMVVTDYHRFSFLENFKMRKKYKEKGFRILYGCIDDSASEIYQEINIIYINDFDRVISDYGVYELLIDEEIAKKIDISNLSKKCKITFINQKEEKKI